MKPSTRLTLATMLAFGLAACGDETMAPEIPGTPSGVSATANGTTVTVSFTPGTNATSHRVTLTGGGDSASETLADGTTTVDFGGLTVGVTYAAVVYAINDAGETASSPVPVDIETLDPTFVLVEGDILEDVTWTSDLVWVLTRPIFVGRDCGPNGSAPDCVEATLTIEPGTTIVGKTDLAQGVRGAYLVVSRGSRIIADATGEDRPPTEAEVIVFTSDKPRGERDRGDWGGIVVNGQAPTNAGDEAEGEGDSGLFGGPDPGDDSGILRGVRIEFAGDDVTPSDQLNGLAPQGVGSGTTISYVQIHHNVDDGIEPFGGTVSVDHLVLTGIGDDSVDGTDGYRGFMQFVLVQQRGDDADQGMELSTSGDDPADSPRSTAVIANATLQGARSTVVDGDIAGAESDYGFMFREGANWRIYNSIATGFGRGGFCMEGALAPDHGAERKGGETDPKSTLSLEGSILWSNNGEGDSDDNFAGCVDDDDVGASLQENRDFFETAGFNNLLADPLLPAEASDIGTQASPPNLIATGIPGGYTPFDLTTIALDDDDLFVPRDGRTLVDTDYPGAVEPGTALADAWYYGWTVWTIDGTDSRANQAGN